MEGVSGEPGGRVSGAEARGGEAGLPVEGPPQCRRPHAPRALRNMARSVQEAFYDIVAEQGAMEQAQAVDYVKLMTKGATPWTCGARPPTLLRRSCPTSCNPPHSPSAVSWVVLPGAAPEAGPEQRLLTAQTVPSSQPRGRGFQGDRLRCGEHLTALSG